LRKQGIGTVVLITEAFAELARATLASRGVPDLPMVIFPHQTEVMTTEELRPVVEWAVDNEIVPLIEAVRDPLA